MIPLRQNIILEFYRNIFFCQNDVFSIKSGFFRTKPDLVSNKMPKHALIDM